MTLPTAFSPGAFLAPAIDWLNANFHPFFALVTRVIEAVLGAFEGALLALPPWALIAVVAVAAFLAINLRAAILAGCCLGFCWLTGLWTGSMQTIALVAVAVAISVAIAFPLGILAARRPAIEAALRPVLDIMQTVPPWVYLIPAVMIFSLGRVPAIIATIVYGIPPMLRLTTLAFRGVPKDLKELGEAIGAKPGTILWKIEFPAATPTLLVGLNQCILLSLAMVVLAGLVGAGGLGAEVTRGLTRMEMGLGLRAGLAIVAVALLMDRLSRGALQQGRRWRRPGAAG
ncbi:ABC transporter permease subunit [Paracoccus sp. PS-1]|uniref:ABC transporter permease n=1 Tax=unclassified Paracoccus (in: a-proteobacteria) TaxID=2688777 RepID=UPI00048BED62|nr:MULTISPECIES: ABC transporter permease subunit [unclassified Paracoccus (in: a-proteobacteria)]MDQ7263614.1 ABC transporter permease subunit [Paracoccus sp. PS1]RQP05852.1 MAG: ABC transporter permease subunit [Paracoccus sp. BP8]UFM67190.1 ABC transporter permease subunit [Paracoccus sp. MA]